MYQFIRVAAATPTLLVADTVSNTEEICHLIRKAHNKQVQVLCFPELSLTGYTCGDLFLQSTLLKSAEDCLLKIAETTKGLDMFVAVGLPVAFEQQIFNCAAALYDGKILGLVPKTYLPNYSEFYEKRWFTSSSALSQKEITLCGQKVPLSSSLLFSSSAAKNVTIGIEICEDLWAPIPPSSYSSIEGAAILLNLSASNALAAKYEYRKDLVCQQSARCMAAYIYASAGIGESTQDTVFSGHSLICENGSILNEARRFRKDSQIILADIDVELLVNDRQKNTSFTEHRSFYKEKEYTSISFPLKEKEELLPLARKINSRPFIPNNDHRLASRCNDIFNIQVTGLAKRITHTNTESLVIGISGGLDSTLALLVAVKAFDFLDKDRKDICGITMPGFGTTDRTYNNAISLMKSLNISIREISIKDATLQHFKDIGHNPSIHNVTYENAQARERTQILMDIANQVNGLVVGTGDLSELALGWSTYNGDHMSMYGVNVGVPKTLVRVLVDWVAKSTTLDQKSNDILFDILDTPVSPELLPPDKDGKITQKTETIVGPYELHDFFLYYVVRFGFSPAKILFLAENAFSGIYDKKTILKWLKNFYRRFFSQQFKRSCLPDGPKVGSVSLSPRSDWRMPTDASSKIWLSQIEKMDTEETEG